MKKTMVVSAVNFTEGGPLTILRDCLAAASSHLGRDWRVIALVHDKKLINIPDIQFLTFPWAKFSWLNRLYYEWWYFLRLSRNLKPDLWFSLHDITPWVSAKRRAVYCHNPSPFYHISWREAWLDPSFLLFNLFYRYLYGINIKSNHTVVVQQDWLRKEFRQLFNIKQIIVAHPSMPAKESLPDLDNISGPYMFFYPCLPRVFKNLEVICEAARLLNKKALGQFEIKLTIDGKENPYSAMLVQRYTGVPGIRFIGRQDHSGMLQEYARCGCMVFPSRLETWGLPITEAKAYGKPILAADLPYAHETVGDYKAAAFFHPEHPKELASIMLEIIEGRPPFTVVSHPKPAAPFAVDWNTLLDHLVEGL